MKIVLENCSIHQSDAEQMSKYEAKKSFLNDELFLDADKN
jgi:hypothetical protein